MIISRTPFRISFFGGGTDFPAWYLQHGGAVLATTIDKYCYLTCRYLPPFFEHKYRVLWSRSERCKTLEDIRHPVIAHAVRLVGIDEGLEIHHDGDLPARSGMGTSSSFAVGLLHALHALRGTMMSRDQLLAESLRLEQGILKECVGSQDQVMAAYGGLNVVHFHATGQITVHPVTLSSPRIAELNDHLMLFFSGISRSSSKVSKKFAGGIDGKYRQLNAMRELVDRGLEILTGGENIEAFGRLLHEAWQVKRSYSSSISTDQCDRIYEAARNAGAIGGKILGAGGGGFMLFFVPRGKRREVRDRLRDLVHVPFQFESAGSQIIHYTAPVHFLKEERELDDRLRRESRNTNGRHGAQRLGAR